MNAVMSTITFQLQSVEGLWDEIMPLFESHWAEMRHGNGPLDLNKDLYEALERWDQARLYTVREEGKLIGYAAYFISPDLWKTGYFSVLCHSIYLLPDYRKGRTGIRLIQFCAEHIQNNVPVSTFRQHTHADRKEGRLFEILGYQHVHNEYEKRVV